MLLPLEISIPGVTTVATPKPHTAYLVSLRLPLRSFTLTKRYSDFAALHRLVTAQAGGAAPPEPLPPKHYFGSTLRDAALTEARRRGLEAYLRAIATAEDARWRDTSAWRTFLNLPGGGAGGGGGGGGGGGVLGSVVGGGGAAVTDPVVWLDVHREVRGLLHEAREHVAARRAGAAGARAQAEEGAGAKRALVRAGTLMAGLEAGLKAQGDGWAGGALGEGEVRRRRDLLACARRDRDRLEEVLSLVGRKDEADAAVEEGTKTVDERQRAVFGARGPVGRGRVLGKETARTRELDNRGVLQLQQDMTREQDEDLQVLEQAVRRQRELAERINEELVVQNEMLGMLDQDVDRVEGKMKVARKRVDKIS